MCDFPGTKILMSLLRAVPLQMASHAYHPATQDVQAPQSSHAIVQSSRVMRRYAHAQKS
jgi:hypothetical protein